MRLATDPILPRRREPSRSPCFRAWTRVMLTHRSARRSRPGLATQRPYLAAAGGLLRTWRTRGIRFGARRQCRRWWSPSRATMSSPIRRRQPKCACAWCACCSNAAQLANALNERPAVNGLTALHDAVLRAGTANDARLPRYLQQIRWEVAQGARFDIPDFPGERSANTRRARPMRSVERSAGGA